MITESSYIQKIKRVIKSCDENIHDVLNIDYVKIVDYTADNNMLISDMILNGKVDEIKDLSNQKKSTENLIVMKLNSQNGQHYFVTIYDNEELWQDPRVIGIYPLV